MIYSFGEHKKYLFIVLDRAPKLNWSDDFVKSFISPFLKRILILLLFVEYILLLTLFEKIK